MIAAVVLAACEVGKSSAEMWSEAVTAVGAMFAFVALVWVLRR